MKKFELTTDTVLFLGKTLYRIKALVSFGSIEAGELGGFVEKEENLAQVSGNAWVSGDAQVSGNARVSGDAQVSGNARVSGDARVSPVVITGLNYVITITDKHIKIGCEFHLITEWKKFSDKRILEMDGKSALTFWKNHKKVIIETAVFHSNREK